MANLKKIFRVHQQHFFAVLLLVFVGGVIYSNSLNASFQFDDELFIVRNSAIRRLADWPEIWRKRSGR